MISILMGSDPLRAHDQDERSRLSISASRMRLLQYAKAKFGAGLIVALKSDMAWSQARGFFKKEMGERNRTGKPEYRGCRTDPMSPMSWCIGSHEIPLSASEREHAFEIKCSLAIRFPWVIWTPRGSEVEPDVY